MGSRAKRIGTGQATKTNVKKLTKSEKNRIKALANFAMSLSAVLFAFRLINRYNKIGKIAKPDLPI